LGRCFALYYNQTRLGRLEIHPDYGYTTETPRVHTDLQIKQTKFLGYRTLTGFLWALANHVTNCDPASAERASVQQSIDAGLLEALWGDYGHAEVWASQRWPDEEHWGEVNVKFDGSAEWYIRRKGPWRETSPKIVTMNRS
jgi:hypothetical protein